MAENRHLGIKEGKYKTLITLITHITTENIRS
jgi:hypothetical protein